MKLVKTLASVTLAAIATIALTSAAANAFSLRSPQIIFTYGPLQGYFVGVGESINVATDQVNSQSFASSVGGNSTITLMAELSGPTASDEIGVYNALDASPALDAVFPPVASAGWFANLHWSGGSLQVYLYDASAVFQGMSTYPGADPMHFGFYYKSQAGLWYSQDARNSGLPQVLTYAGTGANFGDWWECFEPFGYNIGTAQYTGAILLVQSSVPTPTKQKTWGSLKSDYR